MLMVEAATPIANADPLCKLSLRDISARYAARSLSPVDVVTAALDRAEAINPELNAFTLLDRDGALRAARQSEERWRMGEPASDIDGIPTTIKDIVWVENWPIRHGSLSTAATPCAADAPAVSRLRVAGAALIGLTATPEFGWKALTDGPLSGTTRNPWDPAITPGGSSGGAAVAAATGAGLLHLGTDGGGSIRIPCAFTGLTGLKPTYGRVPAYPVSSFGTLAHLGPMTRRVDENFAMLKVMSGRDDADWLQGVGSLPALTDERRSFASARIGYWTEPPCGRVDPEVAAIVDKAVRRLEAIGATIEPIRLPGTDLLETFDTLWFAGATTRVSALTPDQRDRVDPDLLQVIDTCKGLTAVQYLKATSMRIEFARQMEELAARFDLIVSPATTIPAFLVERAVPPGSGYARWPAWAGFSFPRNMSQQPACVVPCGRTGGGLPVGLQMSAARGRDATVMAYAAAFEDVCPEYFL